MAGPCCDNCVYSVFDPEHWRRLMWLGEPILPRCANHPWFPGQLHDVPGVACRNYRRKPKMPEGDRVRLIPLGDGFYAYVDAADYEWLSRYQWRQVNGYAARCQNAKWIFMHREIMQPPKGMVVDHIDANRVNNCRFNLRVCTPAENQRNKRKRRASSSKFIGVSYDRWRHKWCAKCWFAGKQRWLGYFDDEVDAARLYDRAAVESFGEFAHLNFPEEWPPERRAQVCAESSRGGESAFARKPVRPRKSKKATTEDRRRRTAGTKEGKGKKATRRAPDAKPRATKKGKTVKRKSHVTRRKTRPKRATGHGSRPTALKRSHAEPPGRRVQKRKTKFAPATSHEARTSARKGRQR